jgi:hypothetical protein
MTPLPASLAFDTMSGETPSVIVRSERRRARDPVRPERRNAFDAQMIEADGGVYAARGEPTVRVIVVEGGQRSARRRPRLDEASSDGERRDNAIDAAARGPYRP